MRAFVPRDRCGCLIGLALGQWRRRLIKAVEMLGGGCALISIKWLMSLMTAIRPPKGYSGGCREPPAQSAKSD
jgi:hypothetical protein